MKKFMVKILSAAIVLSFMFIGMDCKDDEPCLTCPTPTDTTSHNFVFEIDTLGDGNSSSLYDIAIINDTLAYAVGEIYLNDSIGNIDPHPYNVAIWNGQNWKLKKLYSQGFPPALTSIFIYNENDIWLTPRFHWNGTSFIEMPTEEIFFAKHISKLWGDAKGLYAVGSDGLIAYRSNNGNWQKIESGTTLPIQDIWGAKNMVTGETEIYAVASNNSINQGQKVLRINGSTVSTVPDTGLPWSLRGIWFAPGKSYYVAGDGLYNVSTIGSSWNRVNNLPPYYKTNVRGNHENDIVVSGVFMLLMHYNGKSWKTYFEPTNGILGRVAMRNNFFAVIGMANNRAVIIRGYRK